MEIRVKVDNDFMRQLQELVKDDRATDITRDALTLLNWAAKEVSQGRVIASAKPDGTDVHRLVMPKLTAIGKG